MIQSIFIIQTGFKRDPNVIQTWSKRDPNVNRDSNAFKNNVGLIDLSRGVSLKRSLRLVYNSKLRLFSVFRVKINLNFSAKNQL